MTSYRSTVIHTYWMIPTMSDMMKTTFLQSVSVLLRNLSQLLKHLFHVTVTQLKRMMNMVSGLMISRYGQQLAVTIVLLVGLQVNCESEENAFRIIAPLR